MAEDRDNTVELITATQVTNAELFYTIQKENALLAKLMLDKLKSFLSNDYFTTMERQTILMRFLEQHTDLEVVQDVLNYIQESPLKEDYTTIIMEWTYHNSENIVKQNLAKYDGSLLSLDKKVKRPEFKPQNSGSDDFVQAIVDITTRLLGDGGDDFII